MYFDLYLNQNRTQKTSVIFYFINVTVFWEKYIHSEIDVGNMFQKSWDKGKL